MVDMEINMPYSDGHGKSDTAQAMDFINSDQ